MPLILLHSERFRKALAAPASVGIEAFVILGVAAIFAGLVLIGERAAAPMPAHFEISLRLRHLPMYTAFTLLRGLAAYVLSLSFTLVYGIIAAHNRRAEKIMLPTLDVLQSLPVLTFLPGLIFLFVNLFPHRQLGLEIACVITIFTAQAWNMCFSFFGSVRGIPAPLREVAVIQHLNGWQVFRLLEVPASMIGLVWNSMMSMAGGWFFIAASESFSNYKLPGLGSYMAAAQDAGNHTAEVGAVIAMVVMIVALDQLLWRPIVAWSERFKLEDVSAAELPKSWVLDLLGKSRLVVRANRWLAHRREVRATAAAARRTRTIAEQEHRQQRVGMLLKLLTAVTLAVLAAGFVWGCWALFSLLTRVHWVTDSHEDWRSILLGLFASFARVVGALMIGTLWTLPAGILIGLSPRWSQRLQPIVQVVASFPAPMLFPWVVGILALLHVPFNIGCVTLLLLGTQWYVLFNVIAGAMAIPSDLREAARVYHLGRWYTWRKLYIPAVFPFLITGLLTATGGAWNATIVAEYFQMGGMTQSAFGLGTIIDLATNDNNYPALAASALTMAVFVVTMNRLVWKKLYRVAEQRYSLNI
jgi:NitT/TauT family transport system permease protein